ncbi:hypothetical protein CEN49_25745 [Fischerella thermalis CCMEE 5273]|nr:hypothetical protein CEN49_25745 [Fischerella thermalis CCMEE 5273]
MKKIVFVLDGLCVICILSSWVLDVVLLYQWGILLLLLLLPYHLYTAVKKMKESYRKASEEGKGTKRFE